jgi:hypothetical protein
VTLALKVNAATRRSLLRALRRGRRVVAAFELTATDATGRVTNRKASGRLALPS